MKQQKFLEAFILSDSESVQLPGFKLKFLGKNKQQIREFKIDNYNFEVSQGLDHKNFSWNAGLGMIAPAEIEFLGKTYLIEIEPLSGFKNLFIAEVRIVVKPSTSEP